MRIISGKARRIMLDAPKGDKTRPTSDRAKETLFNILGNRVYGTQFLDLFCGSGAIGIEALSRGASSAVFVDSSKSSIEVTKANLVKSRLEGGRVLLMTVEHAISLFAEESSRFNIIFLDPPYDMRGTDFLAKTLAALSQADILADGGIIVAETDKKTAEAATDEYFALADKRDSGQTSFLFYAQRVTGG